MYLKIKIEWRLLNYVHQLDKLINRDNCTKIIYNCLILKEIITPKKRMADWETDVNRELDIDDWLDDFKTIYKCTTSTKLRNFDYRFRIRDVLTNTRLYKMGISSTEQCYLCGDKESIIHLYWECEYNKRLWERLKNIISNANLQIPNKSECMLGRDEESTVEDIVYLLCTITKKFIHDGKCNKLKPNINRLISNIISVKDSEEKLARKKGKDKYRDFLKNWGKINLI